MARREDEMATELSARAEVIVAIATAVRQAREARQWSRAKLARKAELTEKTIHRLESGQVMPDLETVGAVATAFEMDWKDLLPPPVTVYEASIRYFTQTLFEQGESPPLSRPKRPKLTAQTRRSA